MKSKRLAVLIGIVCLMLVFVVACGPSPAPAPAPAPTPAPTPAPSPAPAPVPEKEVRLRLTCGLPITHYMTEAMNVFKQEVETASNGRITVETYPGGELYKHSDVQNVIPAGAVEMAICGMSHLSGLSPLADVGSYQFICYSLDQWEKAEDVFFPLLEESLLKRKVKPLAFMAYGTQAIAGNKLIRVPADVKGLKIRGPSQATLDGIEAWGGIGASLAAGEVYDALARGSIDAVLTGWSSHGARAHYEVAHFFSGNTKYSSYIMVMNLGVWDALSKDDKEIVMQASEKAKRATYDGLKADEEKWITIIKDSGAEVYFFTPEELEQWQEASQPSFDKVISKCARAGYGDEVIQILKALGLKGI